MKKYQANLVLQKKPQSSEKIFNFNINSFKNTGGKINIDTARKRKISSTKWLTRHVNDKFCKMSKVYGFNSRASFKLIEIVDKFHLYSAIVSSNIIVDLGCSPGGWTQVLEHYILSSKDQKKCKIIALDMIDTDYITNNISYIKGNFESLEVQEELLKISENQKIDFIFSDISPNNTGNQAADRMNIIRTIDVIVKFSENHIKQNGSLVFKSLKGCEEEIFPVLKKKFSKVVRFKPQSSRKESSEIYIICLEKR